MATKIAVTNAKGGVAKTTTAINIADALIFIGYRVLFIDLDPQANSTSVYIPKKNEEYKTLRNLIEGEKAADCIYHGEFGDIIPGDKSLAEEDDVYQKAKQDPALLKKALKSIDRKYDFIVMDTPPNVGAWMKSAIYAADGTVCPVLPKKFAIDGLSELLQKLNEIKKEGNKSLKMYGVVLTVYDQRNAQDKAIKDMLPMMGKALNIHVFETSIRTCQDVEKALAEGKSLFRTKGNSNGAMDYVNLTKEILEEV